MNPVVGVLIALALLGVNGFFVGAEFAVMAARREQIEPLAEAGSRRAAIVLQAGQNVPRLFACAQLGVTVASTSLGAMAEPALARLIVPAFESFGLGPGSAHALAGLLAIVLVVVLHVVLGEMVPKNLALAGPEKAALIFVPPLVAIAAVLRPIIALLNWIAGAVLRLGGLTPAQTVASAFTADQVASIVERSQAEGVLDDAEGLLAGSIEFSDLRAVDVMVDLARLVTLPTSVTPAGVEQAVAQTGFSRFPVLAPPSDDEGTDAEVASAASGRLKRDGTDGKGHDADGADDDGKGTDGKGTDGKGTDADQPAEPRIVGYLHLKDVLFAEGAERDQPVPTRRIRPIALAQPDDEVEDVLAAMQLTGSHLALVRQAGRVGVVFLEDILEELVGEVRDAEQRRQSGRP